MRRQRLPRGSVRRRRDVIARAVTLLAVEAHVGRVARATVPGRQVSADCAGTRGPTFSPARRPPCVPPGPPHTSRGGAVKGWAP